MVFVTKNRFFILSIVILNALMGTGQLPDDEIPPELKELLGKELHKWKEPADIRQGMPYFLSGFDEENRPVWVIEFGKYDIQKLLQKGEKYPDEMYKHVELMLVRMYESITIRATPEDPVTESVVILDMDGYSVQQLSSGPAINYLVRVLGLMLRGVKFVKAIYIINTNFVGENLLRLIKPLFGSEYNKIEVYGTNPARWRPVILKNVPKDQLPEWYGGSPDFKPVQIYA